MGRHVTHTHKTQTIHILQYDIVYYLKNNDADNVTNSRHKVKINDDVFVCAPLPAYVVDSNYNILYITIRICQIITKPQPKSSNFIGYSL